MNENNKVVSKKALLDKNRESLHSIIFNVISRKKEEEKKTEEQK